MWMEKGVHGLGGVKSLVQVKGPDDDLYKRKACPRENTSR